MKSSSLVAAVLLAAFPAAAASQGHCSRETLSVRGTPVTVAYCPTVPAGSGPEVTVPVAATYSSPSGSFSKNSSFRFITGEGPARVLENVDLGQLGLTGTLHLTLVYAGGEVRIENALLTPGAIIIK
ncbi:MAG TPA: hypothetical protein VFN49_11870 [Candidatus Aquilonibacter sp.]|nr:hypothetical protein [Candidatus Aquilonibacter sp.]